MIFSALVPLLKHVTDDILCKGEEDTTLTTDIKQQIVTYLQDKYDDTELKELLYIASFLDPRFKTEYIPNGNMAAIKERISLEGLPLTIIPLLLLLPLKVQKQVHLLRKNTRKYFKEK